MPPKASTSKAVNRSAPKSGIKLDAPLLDATRHTQEYQREDDQCPVCGTERYLKPTLRLLVSRTCFDRMCESCIDRLFSSGPAPCPTCSTMIRKVSFAPQRFEDLSVEKEVHIRQAVSSCFNKRKEDFDTLLEYNNYLEEVEDITFNLIHNVDVQATEERIRAYRKQNQTLIDKNTRREQDEKKQGEKRAAAERAQHAAERARYAALDAQVEADRQAVERELMLNLSVAGGDAEAAKAAMRKAKASAVARAEAAASAAADISHLMGGSGSKTMPTNTDAILLPEDPLGDIDRFDDGSTVFDLPDPKMGYADDRWTEVLQGNTKALAGGYSAPAFWELCVRSAVQGLFAPPLITNEMAMEA